MDDTKAAASAIARIVEHHGGAAAVSVKFGGKPVAQQIQCWVRRGWASPMHFQRLLPLARPLKLGMADLYADREREREPA